MVFNNRAHLRDMQLRAVAVDTRHVFVDFDDESFSRAGYLGRIVVFQSRS